MFAQFSAMRSRRSRGQTFGIREPAIPVGTRVGVGRMCSIPITAQHDVERVLVTAINELPRGNVSHLSVLLSGNDEQKRIQGAKEMRWSAKDADNSTWATSVHGVAIITLNLDERKITTVTNYENGDSVSLSNINCKKVRKPP